MRKPKEGRKIVLARDIDGRTELVEWIRHADTVWIVADEQETAIGPNAWKQAGLIFRRAASSSDFLRTSER